MWRQGDVLIIPVDDAEFGGEEVLEKDRNDRVVLAYGEVTGHAHAFYDREAAALYEPDDNTLEQAFKLKGGGSHLKLVPGDRVLKINKSVPLKHEEHSEIPLPPGLFIVRGQREYTPEEIRRVAD